MCRYGYHGYEWRMGPKVPKLRIIDDGTTEVRSKLQNLL
jgi:hypothetical protein